VNFVRFSYDARSTSSLEATRSVTRSERALGGGSTWANAKTILSSATVNIVAKTSLYDQVGLAKPSLRNATRGILPSRWNPQQFIWLARYLASQNRGGSVLSARITIKGFENWWISCRLMPGLPYLYAKANRSALCVNCYRWWKWVRRLPPPRTQWQCTYTVLCSPHRTAICWNHGATYLSIDIESRFAWRVSPDHDPGEIQVFSIQGWEWLAHELTIQYQKQAVWIRWKCARPGWYIPASTVGKAGCVESVVDICHCCRDDIASALLRCICPHRQPEHRWSPHPWRPRPRCWQSTNLRGLLNGPMDRTPISR